MPASPTPTPPSILHTYRRIVNGSSIKGQRNFLGVGTSGFLCSQWLCEHLTQSPDRSRLKIVSDLNPREFDFTGV